MRKYGIVTVALVVAAVWCLAARASCPAGTYPAGYTTIQWNEDPEGPICVDDPPYGTGASPCESYAACFEYAYAIDATLPCRPGEYVDLTFSNDVCTVLCHGPFSLTVIDTQDCREGA